MSNEYEAETCKCNKCNKVFPSKEIPEGCYGAVLCGDCREGLGPNVRDVYTHIVSEPEFFDMYHGVGGIRYDLHGHKLDSEINNITDQEEVL